MTDTKPKPLVTAPADAQVLRGPWRAHQQQDGDWEVRAIINEQGHHVLLAAAPDMLAAIRTTQCPRPANAVHADWTVEQCCARKECGCDLGTAYLKARGASQ